MEKLNTEGLSKKNQFFIRMFEWINPRIGRICSICFVFLAIGCAVAIHGLDRKISLGSIIGLLIVVIALTALCLLIVILAKGREIKRELLTQRFLFGLKNTNLFSAKDIDKVVGNLTDRITALIAGEFGVEKEDIRNGSRKRDCLIPRYIFFYFCQRLFSEMTQKEIAEMAGRKSRSTVYRGIYFIRLKKASDIDLAPRIFRIEAKLYR